MITDKDIEKLKKVFATKDELNGCFKSFAKEIIDYIDSSHQGLHKEMTEYVQTLAKEISSVLTNHEGRIDKLEKRTFSQN